MHFLQKAVVLLAFGMFLAQPGVPLFAGAYDQLTGMAGGSANVPDVPPPTRVDPPDSSDSSDSSSESYTPSIFSRLFTVSPEEQAKREQRRIQRQKTREEQKRKREAQRRHEAQQRRKRQAERRRQEPPTPAPVLLPPPRPLTSLARKAPPSLRPPSTTVPAGTEAQSLQKELFRIETLRKKSRLTDQEKVLLGQLQDACRNLWAKAAGKPGQSMATRERLRIDLPIEDAAPTSGRKPLISREAVATWMNAVPKTSDTPLGDMISSFQTERMESVIEQESGRYMKKLYGEAGKEAFENVLGLAKITMEVGKNDLPAAAKETIDFLIGMIAQPQAAWAVSGGRIYADVAFQALDDFMVKSMKGVGVDFDTKEFWQKFRDDLNGGQKTVFQWIGGVRDE